MWLLVNRLTLQDDKCFDMPVTHCFVNLDQLMLIWISYTFNPETDQKIMDMLLACLVILRNYTIHCLRYCQGLEQITSTVEVILICSSQNMEIEKFKWVMRQEISDIFNIFS